MDYIWESGCLRINSFLNIFASTEPFFLIETPTFTEQFLFPKISVKKKEEK